MVQNYFKFIAHRNIHILKYMLVIIGYLAVRDSALITIIIDHIILAFLAEPSKL